MTRNTTVLRCAYFIQQYNLLLPDFILHRMCAVRRARYVNNASTGSGEQCLWDKIMALCNGNQDSIPYSYFNIFIGLLLY
jgi:hypothetical protein